MDLFSWSPKVTKQLPLPGEWHPQAVAQVAVTILFAAGLLNLLERIVILLKVKMLL